MALTLSPVLLQNLENPPNVVARVHHDRLARHRIAHNRAVTLQHPHRNHFMNQLVAHNFLQYNSPVKAGSLFPSVTLWPHASLFSFCYYEIEMETPLAKLELAEGAKLADFTGCALPEVFSDFDAVNTVPPANPSPPLIPTGTPPLLSPAPDRVRYVIAIVTNDFKALSEGIGKLALLLNPQRTHSR